MRTSETLRHIAVISGLGLAAGAVARDGFGKAKDAQLTELYHQACPNHEGEPTAFELYQFEDQLEKFGWARGQYDLDLPDGEVKPTGFAFHPSEEAVNALEQTEGYINVADWGIVITAVLFIVSSVGTYMTRKKAEAGDR